MKRRWAGSGLRSWTLANLAVAVCYVLSCALILGLDRFFGMDIPLRPAAGLAFVCVLRRGAPLLPGIMAGALVIDVLDLTSRRWSPGHLALFSALPAAASSLQALACAAMVDRWLVRVPSSSTAPGDHPVHWGSAGPLSRVIAMALGVTTLALGGGSAVGRKPGSVRRCVRWVGDSIGVIIFAPLLPTAAAESRHDLARLDAGLVALPSLADDQR